MMNGIIGLALFVGAGATTWPVRPRGGPATEGLAKTPSWGRNWQQPPSLYPPAAPACLHDGFVALRPSRKITGRSSTALITVITSAGCIGLGCSPRTPPALPELFHQAGLHHRAVAAKTSWSRERSAATDRPCPQLAAGAVDQGSITAEVAHHWLDS